MELINKFGYISENMVGDYFELNQKAVSGVGDRLKKAGLIKKERVLVSDRQYWFLDKLGAEIISGKLITRISPSTVIHNSYVFKLAINYLKQSKKVKLEKEARHEQGIKFNSSEVFLPDLLIDESKAIEVELSIKSPKRITKKVARYNFDVKILEVHWISNKEIVLKKLQKLISGAKHKFYIFDNDVLNLTEYGRANVAEVSERKFLK